MVDKMRDLEQKFDDIFYRNGICHTKLNPISKRKRFHNPLTILIVTSLVLFERLVSALNPKKSKQMVRILADGGHYFNMAWIWDILIILFSFLVLTTNILFFVNYKKGNFFNQVVIL